MELASTSSTSELLRRFLLWLGAASTVGTAVELAMLRHWKGIDQLIPWAALLVALVAIGLLSRRPTRSAVKIARVLAVAVTLSALVGLFEHVHGNYESGPLDAEYSRTWDSMSEASRWFAAVTESVGPSPPVAPAVLAQVGLVVLFATVRHPALESTD